MKTKVKIPAFVRAVSLKQGICSAEVLDEQGKKLYRIAVLASDRVPLPNDAFYVQVDARAAQQLNFVTE